MPTMIRPKLSFEANNATATPQNARSLSARASWTNRSISEKNGRLTPPATTASGLRVPQVAAKEEGTYFMYATDD